MQTFIAFDLETTGLTPFKDKMIELAGIKFQLSDDFSVPASEINTFSTLINPEINIPEEASRVNHIYNQDVKDSPVAKAILNDFLDFVGKDSILLAHNAEFDSGFLGAELLGSGFELPKIEVWDTLTMAKALVPNLINYRLETLVHHFAIPISGFHRALDDSRYLVKLSFELLKIAGSLKELKKNSGNANFSDIKQLLDVRLSLKDAPITSALRNGKQLSFEYEVQGQRQEVLILPKLLYKGEKLNWLQGIDLSDRQLKNYRIDRISKIKIKQV